MTDDMEKEVRDLRERLVTLEVESRSDRRWLKIVGILLLSMLGYTNFVALPNEVESQLPGAVKEKIDTEAPKHVKGQFARWLSVNNGGAILESLHKAQMEVSRIETRAKANEASIQAYLQQAQNADVLNSIVFRKQDDDGKLSNKGGIKVCLFSASRPGGVTDVYMTPVPEWFQRKNCQVLAEHTHVRDIQLGCLFADSAVVIAPVSGVPPRNCGWK